MNKLVLSTIFFIILVLFVGCFSQQHIVSGYGDNAILKFQNGNKLECEIICFLDSTIIFSPLPEHHFSYSSLPRTLYYVSIDNLKSISIEGYDGKGWKKNVLLFQVIPTCLFTIAAATAEVQVTPAILIGGIPTLITTLFFLGSEVNAPQWNNKDSLNQIFNLNIYSRYPNGLNNIQISKLLEQSDQNELKEYVLSK